MAQASNTSNLKIFEPINNYVYFYHLDEFIILPAYPESIQDQLQAHFSNDTPLLRTAPIYSYHSSGPRSMQVSLSLHREYMKQINIGKSNASVKTGDDYVDTLIKYVHAMALPRYEASQKMVNPPLIAMRLADDIFIKGVVDGAVGVSYKLPIIHDNGKDKYAAVDISFSVSEVEPYDADYAISEGSLRGLSTTLEGRFYKK